VLSVRELLEGSVMVSGNDAAVTLSQLAPTQSEFVGDMNSLALRIGLQSTHFANPVGLDAPGQYATPQDLVKAAAYLDGHYPFLAQVAATIRLDIAKTASHPAFQLQNLDKLLWEEPGVNGLKGGYTGQAQGCVLVTATHLGHRLVGVILGSPPSPGAFQDARALFNYGYAVIGAAA
jgi:D-alanyl-D-alanine carboxypeptidase